jgi:hypothetical protein
MDDKMLRNFRGTADHTVSALAVYRPVRSCIPEH